MSEENELPKGWVWCKLKDLLAPLADGRIIHQGWSPQCESEPSSSDDDWGVLKTTAIQNGEFQPSYNKKLPASLVPRTNLEVKSGDLLLTCAGPRVRCGIPCLVRSTRPKLIISGKMYRMRVSEPDVQSEFIEAFLCSPSTQKIIDGMKTGISESGLNLTHARFFTLEIPFPPTNEQIRIKKKIAALQSRSKRAREALESIPPLIEKFRQSVLAAAFRGDLTKEWREKNKDKFEPASELLKRIKIERRFKWEEEQLKKFKASGKVPKDDGWKNKYKEPEVVDTEGLPELPEGWCWASVEHGSVLITDGKHGDCRDSAASGYYFISAKDIKNGKINYDRARQILYQDFLEVHQRTNLEAGNVLITNSGTIGRVAIAGDDLRTAKTTFQKSVAIIKLVSSCLVGEFLTGYLTDQMTHVQYISQGTAQKNLLLSDLRRMPLAICSVEEQRQIIEELNLRLGCVSKLQEMLALQSQNLSQLDQSILAKAFRGELVEQDPNDEPASVLLERIRKEREEAQKNKSKTSKPSKAKSVKAEAKSQEVEEEGVQF